MDETTKNVAEVERLRRSKSYLAMQKLSNELFAQLKHTIEPEAELVRARVYYEMSMEPLQIAWDTPPAVSVPPALYEKALLLANYSARHAHNAGDAIGVMFAEVNIGGHILPGLGKKEEGVAMLRRVLERALAIFPDSEQSEKRLEQVLKNTRVLIDKNMQ